VQQSIQGEINRANSLVNNDKVGPGKRLTLSYVLLAAIAHGYLTNTPGGAVQADVLAARHVALDRRVDRVRRRADRDLADRGRHGACTGTLFRPRGPGARRA